MEIETVHYIWCNTCQDWHPLYGDGWDCIRQYNNQGCSLDFNKIKQEGEKCACCGKLVKETKRIKVLGKEMEVCKECHKRISDEIWERQHI